jgi:hypothetical protein
MVPTIATIDTEVQARCSLACSLGCEHKFKRAASRGGLIEDGKIERKVELACERKRSLKQPFFRRQSKDRARTEGRSLWISPVRQAHFLRNVSQSRLCVSR